MRVPHLYGLALSTGQTVRPPVSLVHPTNLTNGGYSGSLPFNTFLSFIV